MENFNQLHYSPDTGGGKSPEELEREKELEETAENNKIQGAEKKEPKNPEVNSVSIQEDKINRSSNLLENSEEYHEEYLVKLFSDYPGYPRWIKEADTVNQYERKELLDYLTTVVFPYFKITLEDENNYKKEIEKNVEMHDRVKQINIESFQNTRAFIAEFFGDACLYGTIRWKEMYKLLMKLESEKSLKLIEAGLSELTESEKHLSSQEILENLVKYYNEENISKEVTSLMESLKEAVQILSKRLDQKKDDKKKQYLLSLFNTQTKRESYKEPIIKEIENNRKELEDLKNEYIDIKDKSKKVKIYEQIKELQHRMNYLESILPERTDNGSFSLKKDFKSRIKEINDKLAKLEKKNISFDQLKEIFKDNNIDKKSEAEVNDLYNLIPRPNLDYFYHNIKFFLKIQEIKKQSSEKLSELIDNSLTEIIENPNWIYAYQQEALDYGLYHAIFSLISISKLETFQEKVYKLGNNPYEGWEEIFQKNKEKYIKKFPKELVFETLKKEVKLIKDQINYFCTNRDFEGLEEILKIGKILPTLNLVKLRENNPNIKNLKGNAIFPQELTFGFEKGTPLLYGTFIGGREAVKGKELQEGGASGYGPVFFLINPNKLKNRIIFAKEGRSYFPDKNGVNTKRNITDFSLDHIPIIKAINNIKYGITELKIIPFYYWQELDSNLFYNFNFEYLAAQVIGEIDLKEVESININAKRIEEEKIQELINKYPQYKNKFKITNK